MSDEHVFRLGRSYERGLIFGVLIQLAEKRNGDSARSSALTLLAELTRALEELAPPLGVGVAVESGEAG